MSIRKLAALLDRLQSAVRKSGALLVHDIGGRAGESSTYLGDCQRAGGDVHEEWHFRGVSSSTA